MESSSLGLLSLAAYGLSRIAEWRRHRANFRDLSEAGAREVNSKLMRRYYGASLWIMPLLLLESWGSAAAELDQRYLLAAVAATSAGFCLRVWSIHSLGRWWTMRCMVHPGMRPLRVGPYRFLKHPEYLARFVELCGLGVLLGAPYATVAGGIFLAFLAQRAARLEARQAGG